MRTITLVPALLATSLLLGACGAPVTDSEADNLQQALSPTASASNKPLVGADKLDPSTILREVSLEAIGDTPLELENGDILLVSEAAQASLARHHELTDELERVPDALFGEPVTRERFVETDREVVLEASTAFVVRDPKQLRESSKRFSNFRRGTKPGTAFVTDFNAEQREKFNALKRSLRDEPDDHPLKVAAGQGDQALLDAVIRGLGNVLVTSVVRMPKRGALERQGQNLMVPSYKGSGKGLDYEETRPLKLPFAVDTKVPLESTSMGLQATIPNDVPEQDPYTWGEATTVSKFVAGFQVGDGWYWDETWSLADGHLTLGAGVYFALGIRFPFEVTGTMSPTSIVLHGSEDVDGEFETDLSVETVDGDAAFYEAAGVPADEVYDGDEFVATASAYMTIDLEFGFGLIKVDETFPKDPVFDHGQNFTPPLGESCGSNCGIEFWIPSNVTRTNINFAGIVHGEAQLGMLLTGDGSISLDYESLFDDEEVVSQRAGNDELTHRLTFNQESSRHFVTELPALEEPGTKSFGYRLSDAEYALDLEVVPGVKGTLNINAQPFYSDVFEVTLWIPQATIPVGDLFGSLEFPNLGTKRRKVNKGSKQWRELQHQLASDSVPAHLDTEVRYVQR